MMKKIRLIKNVKCTSMNKKQINTKDQQCNNNKNGTQNLHTAVKWSDINNNTSANVTS